MTFVSLRFIAYLVVLLFFYFIVPKKWQMYVLLLGSIFFYFTFSKQAFIFLLLSAAAAFYGSRFISECHKPIVRKAALFSVIGFELLLLIGLKYLNGLTNRFGIVVPLGISFYTLSVIGYLVDVYQMKYTPPPYFFGFLLFVCYFPHILQGPIARYDQLGPQFEEYHAFDYNRVMMGLQLMVWGYMKKMIIADRAAIFVDSVYGQYQLADGMVLFIASILYSIQIYADFSGCVDIASGVSKVLGIELICNFRQPYLAESINDFWKRWHISLSSWFRDYLYIPLGGNRKGIWRRWLNVLIVFVVSGFWHGVGINYIVWGLLHGIYQVIGYLLLPVRKKTAQILHFSEKTSAGRALHILGTFLLVNFAWIYFRVSSIGDANIIIKNIITDFSPWILTDGSLYGYGLSEMAFKILIVFTLLMLWVDICHEKDIVFRERIQQECIVVRWGIYMIAVLSVFVFGVYGIGYDASSFIYMNF